ncbi:hypothetical protein AMES_5712 [Amycolatopsis mediterranei S699]|uniref:MalT-like TPR region domain-containing protein n=2 Tax=Amycolatopsis mediterranei TaxID=33910 RepID=A0A0H3DB81_AMYMU|nr:tetratricopeptide repeat protein [Amycolatopsis mediterranei]ADJ47537.1 hypothetical protein AMED_5790 [Amycolatopsis mediterranei U32]AEK44402.1 hypothetical protein RAM_29635 [Amycolatopsis mediterranei S699]AFO79248.1 hypothetical protein AMES_5712 [Amycolatopsis mediterranei S699]AGT86376.1 hypothetical protein B737_5712 [Amycolatopsis mediterranei RB]KDO12825.1 hypothetical protein DV26_00090 [Amycolatopsis mediterranei]
MSGRAQDLTPEAAAELLLESFRGEGYRKLDVKACAHVLGIGKSSFTSRFGRKRAMMIITALWCWLENPVSPCTERHTVGEARRLLHDVAENIAGFLHRERTLMVQLVYGLSDISNYEKNDDEKAWRSESFGEPWATVLRAARTHNRWVGFAPRLREGVEVAARAVGHLDTAAHQSMADALSDLLLRVWWQNTHAPATVIAEQVTGLWFSGMLLPATGPWVGRAYAAEQQLLRALRPEHAPTWEIASRTELGTALISGQTLWRRALREFGLALTEFSQLEDSLRAQPSPLLIGSLRSRHGQCALRYGDYPQAQTSLTEALREARRLGNEHDIARARTNLAELYMRTGRVTEALTLARQAVAARPLRPVWSSPVPRLWDAAVVSTVVLTRAHLHAGQVTDAVRLAEDLLEVIDGEGGRAVAPDGPTAALARATHGRALLAAGHPDLARRSVTDAVTAAANATGRHSLLTRQARTLEARCYLALGDPESACRILDELVQDENWVAEHMSFRHALSVRVWLGAAWLAAGDAARSAQVLDDGLALLRRHLTDPDPQSIEYRRVAAVTAWQLDQAAAVADLERLVDASSSTPVLPRHVDLLHDLGQAYAARGEGHRARQTFRRALREGETGIDPAHPSVLAVRVALARLQLDDSPEHAAKLLEPVLSDRPLAHGLTALAKTHPLLSAARSLRDRIAKSSGTQ